MSGDSIHAGPPDRKEALPTSNDAAVASLLATAEMEGPRVAEPADRFGFLRADDEVELYYRFWAPLETKAVVVALHGLGAHGEWYESLAGCLLPRGIATLAPDLRGHGLTRWDLGRIPGPDSLIDDTFLWIAHVRRRYPGRPVFLLGTSLGACLAAAAAGRAEEGELQGLILLSPSFAPTYLGWREKAWMGGSLLFGREAGAATPLGRGLSICGDPLRLEWLRRDPLALPWLTARSHWNARRIIRRALGALSSVRIPLLCVQGGRDPVTDPQVTQALLERRERTRFLTWASAFHDLALERDQEFLSGILADWMRHQGSNGEAAASGGPS